MQQSHAHSGKAWSMQRGMIAMVGSPILPLLLTDCAVLLGHGSLGQTEGSIQHPCRHI